MINQHHHMTGGIALLLLAAGLFVPAARGAEEVDLGEEPTNVELAEGLSIRLWAKEPMLASPVAITLDGKGRAYVSRTVRRRHSALPIRSHEDWMPDDLALESVEDRRAHHRRKLAPELSDQNDWLTDFNGDGKHDWRDLTVQSDKIYRIEDTDGDGVADRSTIFAEGFDTEVSGIAGGVLWHRDSLYATVVPDLWRLRDTDGDGEADERESLSHGHGVHMGFSGHNMHGPVVGPDGRIYWSIGDIGSNVVGPDGKRWKYPHEGAVFRCEPDGSDFEVFAHGLRNPQELAFDPHGNLFTVDNDSDRGGDRERIVYITRGSDSGWRIYWQYGGAKHDVWIDEGLYKPRFEGQPAYITPAVAHYSQGPAGFVRNPGTALSERYRDHFFVAEFTGSSARGKVTGFTLKQDGATFELTASEDVVQGVLTTGLDFGPDGALYLADWIDGWVPHERGRVWKVEASSAGNASLQRQTARLLGEEMGDRSAEALENLLGHADMRVRKKAQFELVTRGQAGRRALLNAARDTERELARLHGIWGIGQLGRERAGAVEPLIALLSDGDAEVRAQAAKVIGEAGYEPALKPLIDRLNDDSPRVRFFAAMALGELGQRRAFEPLVSMLRRNGGEDAYLRHAGVMGLSGIGDTWALRELAEDESEAVRIAAVVALRELRHPAVAAFLDDGSERVVAEAARAIHDDFSIPEAVPDLAAVLDEQRSWKDEALLRRAINANLRLGGAERAKRLARYAGRSGAPVEMRAEALHCLAVWAAPPTLDRVEGKYAPIEAHDAAVARKALRSRMKALLTDGPTKVKAAASGAAGALKVREAAPGLYALLEDQDQPTKARLAALKALGELGGRRVGDAIGLALDASDEALRKEARRLLANIEGSGEAAVAALTAALEKGSLREKQSALKTLGGMGSAAANGVLARHMQRLLDGEVASALRLDVLNAARQAASGSEKLGKLVERYEVSLPDDDPLAGWRVALRGGDAEAGKKIVLEHVSAQCIRCHQIDGEGGEVAPDLTKIGGDRDRPYLLEALIQPGAEIAEGYAMVTLTLEDGSTVAGTLGSESDSHVTVQTLSGEKQKVSKDEIANRQTTKASAMPPMGGILSKEQVRDVIAYLATLK